MLKVVKFGGSSLASAEAFSKVKNIVEKILLSEKEINNRDIAYVDSNKGKVTKASLEEIIDTIISMYEKNLLDAVCTDRAYEMMQEANPDKNISKEEFIEYIRIALDIA